MHTHNGFKCPVPWRNIHIGVGQCISLVFGTGLQNLFSSHLGLNRGRHRLNRFWILSLNWSNKTNCGKQCDCCEESKFHSQKLNDTEMPIPRLKQETCVQLADVPKRLNVPRYRLRQASRRFEPFPAIAGVSVVSVIPYFPAVAVLVLPDETRKRH